MEIWRMVTAFLTIDYGAIPYVTIYPNPTPTALIQMCNFLSLFRLFMQKHFEAEVGTVNYLLTMFLGVSALLLYHYMDVLDGLEESPDMTGAVDTSVDSLFLVYVETRSDPPIVLDAAVGVLAPNLAPHPLAQPQALFPSVLAPIAAYAAPRLSDWSQGLAFVH
eukprot:1136327-Amorphochlora_amoeboformis.AAC.1